MPDPTQKLSFPNMNVTLGATDVHFTSSKLVFLIIGKHHSCAYLGLTDLNTHHTYN